MSKSRRPAAKAGRQPSWPHPQPNVLLRVATSDWPSFPLAEVAATYEIFLGCLRLDPPPPERTFRLLAMRLALAVVAARYGQGDDGGC